MHHFRARRDTNLDLIAVGIPGLLIDGDVLADQTSYLVSLVRLDSENLTNETSQTIWFVCE